MLVRKGIDDFPHFYSGILQCHGCSKEITLHTCVSIYHLYRDEEWVNFKACWVCILVKLPAQGEC